LQRVQNTLARVVLRAGKFEHVTPALIQLHWLPVKQRAMYKLALITFNVLQHSNPMYLRDLLTTHNPSRNLRSSSQHLLSVVSDIAMFVLKRDVKLQLTNLLSVVYMRTVSSSRCLKHSAAIGTICRLTFELATLLMFLNVNLRLIFSTLPLLPSHVSSRAYD